MKINEGVELIGEGLLTIENCKAEIERLTRLNSSLRRNNSRLKRNANSWCSQSQALRASRDQWRHRALSLEASNKLANPIPTGSRCILRKASP